MQLKVGDVIEPGHQSAYNMLGNEKVYFTHSPREAEKYARGIPSHGLTVHGKPVVYEVEPTGEYGDDPGSSYAYRSASPLKIVAVHTVPNAPLNQGYTLPPATFSNNTLKHGPKYIGQDAEYMEDAQWFEDKWYGKSFDDDDVDGPMWRLGDGDYLAKGAADPGDPNPVEAEHVYSQLLENYPPKAIKWVKKARWIGPVRVPIDRVDVDDEKKWAAHHEPARVDHFADQIKDGKDVKPAICVQEPGESRVKVIDGHHRYLGAKKAGEDDFLTYVGFVKKNGGPWDETHVYQVHHDADPLNKVGPKGYIHGWIKVGPGAVGSESLHTASAAARTPKEHEEVSHTAHTEAKAARERGDLHAFRQIIAVGTAHGMRAYMNKKSGRDDPITHDEINREIKQRTSSRIPLIEKASPEEITSLNHYVGSGYQDINKHLRGNENVPPQPVSDNKYARVLSSLIGKHKSTQDVTLYRGIQDPNRTFRDEYGDKVGVGDEFTDYGFSSTSTVASTAKGFAHGRGGAVLRIHAPAGTNMISPRDVDWQNPAENEALLQHGTRFRITGDTVENGIRIIDAEVVDQGNEY